MPYGILTPSLYENKITSQQICVASNNLEIDSNSILENIKILLQYIISQKLKFKNGKNKSMTLPESKVEDNIRNYLVNKGWKIEKGPKKRSEHGVDIYASHPTWRKTYRIEVKGEGASHPLQAQHNAFWTILGQIITRMDIEGNQPNKARFYGIGIPKIWEKLFKRKIKDMKFGWKLLKLKVFLVDAKGKVEEKPYTYFLKK